MKRLGGPRPTAAVRLVLALLVLVLLFVLAACGSDTTASGSSSATSSPTAASSSGVPSATPLPTPTVAGTIAFCKVVEGVEGGDADIYLVRPDGTRLTRLTEYGGWEESPSWSPDGKKIAYARYAKGSTEGAEASVWVMSADGSGERRLTSRGCAGPSWSPDGTMIAHVEYPPGGDAWDVFVMNADGSGQRAVISSPDDEGNPVWTSDGRIVFRRGDTALYAVNPDGSGMEQLLSDVQIGGYAVSPDGTSLAYEDLLIQVQTALTDAIVVKPLRDGSEPKVVLEPVSAYVENDPVAVAAWQPDGTWLAVASYNPHSLMGSPLYVVNADGSGLSSVPGVTNAMDPAWRPE